MKPGDLARKVIDAIGGTRLLLTGQTLDAIKSLSNNPSAKAEDLQRILPPENILAIGLAAADEIDGQMPEILRRELLSLREFSQREFPTLKNLEAFKQAALDAHRSLSIHPNQPSEISDAELQPKTITNVLAVPFLAGDDVLAPTLRLVMRTNHKGVDYEFFANAEQLSAIAAALMVYLGQMFEQRAPLVGKGVAKISDPREVAIRINILEQALEKVRQFAPTYGIVLDAPSTDENRSTPSV